MGFAAIPASLDSAVAWLAAQGREPFILLERWEEPLFRERFGAHSALGNLDWPPRFEIDRQVRIYAPRSRAYLRATVPTSTSSIRRVGRSAEAVRIRSRI